MKTLAESLTVGDPQDPSTWIGPMVRADQQQRIQSYIKLGIEEGAPAGNRRPRRPGRPRGRLLRAADRIRRCGQHHANREEEIFGPVLVIIPFEDDDDAVRIANDSPYGLGGGVWTADRDHGLDIARRIRAGTVTVNGADPGSDAPFGGYKASGIGREFGAAGLNHYVELKTIAV